MQTNSSHSQLILLEANFKINLNLASFPYSGWQISLWLFFLKEKKKRTLKAAACDKQNNQPLLRSKITGCSQGSRKKTQDTSVAVSHARKPSCYHQCGLISHPAHSLLEFLFDFVSNYSAIRKSRWVEKLSPCIIVRISSLAWERLPQAFPTWLRCSPPQRSKGGYENRN